MSNDSDFRSFRRRIVIVGYGVSTVIVGTFVAGWVLYGSEIKTENIGDYIGAAASSLALVWLLIGIYLQGYEISLQTRELSASKLELARQAEALAEQVSLIKEQSRFIGTQVELSKVPTAQSLYNNLLVDLAREVRSATDFMVAFDSEEHLEPLNDLRNSGNLHEYVNYFYLNLLGVPKYDLIHYIECANESDAKRLSFHFMIGLTRNLRSIARFDNSIALLGLELHQTYDFLEVVLSTVCNLRYISDAWVDSNYPLDQLWSRLAPFEHELNPCIERYLARVTEYPDWEKWPELSELANAPALHAIVRVEPREESA